MTTCKLQLQLKTRGKLPITSFNYIRYICICTIIMLSRFTIYLLELQFLETFVNYKLYHKLTSKDDVPKSCYRVLGISHSFTISLF